MRLAHVIPTYPQDGGVAAVIANLVTASGPEHDVVLTYGGAVHNAVSARRRRWFQALSWVPWAIPLPADPVLRQLRALPSGSAVLTHGVFTTSCARAGALARRYRPDLIRIAFPHDPYDAGLFGSHRWRKQAYWHLIERRYLRAADLVVCLAPSHVERLRERRVATPAVVARLGLDPGEAARARAAARLPRRDPAGSLRLLVLGRWDVYEKGLDLLCAALGRVAPDTEVRFVGPPVDGTRALHALIAEHRLTGAATVGFVPDIWSHIAWADALCMPSRKEGFGLAALQGLAAARPVLLSRSAGLSEHLRECACVVAVDPNIESVAAGLRTLLAAAGPGSPLEHAAQVNQDRILGFSWSDTRHTIIEAARSASRRRTRRRRRSSAHP